MTDREPFSTAVWKQPETLEHAVRHITASVDAARIAPWKAGETVAVIAMGASTHSAHALVAALAERGVRSANLTASDLLDSPAGFEPGDHYVVVSESGRSPEPIEAARRLAPGRRIAVTNYPEAQIAEVADQVVGYGGIPDSPVYTAGYLATLVSYGALIRAAGLPEAIDEGAVPQQVGAALERYRAAAADAAALFDGVRSADLVGRGYSYTSAAQGALVFREALRLPTAPYETFQYLHGPMEAAGQGTGLVVFGDGRELDIVRDQAEAGVKVLVVSAAPAERLAELAHDNVLTVPLPAHETGLTRVITETIVIHLVTEAIAARRGITIEEFLYSQPDTKLEELAA